MPIHMQCLESFAAIGSQTLSYLMLILRIPQSIIRNMKSSQIRVVQSTSATIKNILRNEMKKIIDEQANIHLSNFISSEIAESLYEDGLIRGNNYDIKLNSAIVLGWLFYREKLPDNMKEIIHQLKIGMKENNIQNKQDSLFSLSLLANCSSNHVKILEAEILNDIGDILSSIKQGDPSPYRIQLEQNGTIDRLEKILFKSTTDKQTWGDEAIFHAIQDAISIDEIRTLISTNSNSMICLNMRELLSWIKYPVEMKRITKLQRDLQMKTADERSEASEIGALKDVHRIMKRIVDEEEEDISGAIDPVCNLITLLMDGNPQIIPGILEKGELIELLITHMKKSNITECLINQIEPIYMIVNECTDDMLQEMFKMGIIQAISKHLENDDKRVVIKASYIILQVIEAGSANIKEGEQNIFKNELENDGTVCQLIEVFLNEEDDNTQIKGNIGVAISLIHKSLQLPSQQIELIVEYVKNLLKGLDEEMTYIALVSLVGLAEFKDNHELLLAEEFINDILQILRRKGEDQINIEIMHLLRTLIMLGSNDAKNKLKVIIPSTLIRQFSFNRNKEVSNAAKDLLELLKI
ncbi:MAG: hypothetical protein EZS28_011523 [Streblomastix strix]|uniref:Uncharacterized protein n=1 Tax=Streblomastix strix TaxID=222440 RepID=A0A5J4WEG5_9EUKA|nr:MAG: hypothetical protein EZS28_011523 [Streblomastix strix]